MKIALLILAAKAPLALKELITTFADHPSFELYIHIDKKIDANRYQPGIIQMPGNVRFLSERIAVYWGGYSMVEATKRLAQEALRDRSTEILCLISDDTFPLCHPDIVANSLTSRPSRIDLAPTSQNKIHLQRYTGYYFLDCSTTTARTLPVEEREIEEELMDAVSRIKSLRKKGKYPIESLWSGSQWWTLDRRNVETIITELDANHWLRESMVFSAIPDELVFHSLYAIKNRVAIRTFTSAMHIELSRVPAPYIYRSLEEVPPWSSDKLFARKVANDCADLMMRQLRYLWNE